MHTVNEQPFSLRGALEGMMISPLARLLERLLDNVTGLEYLGRQYRKLPLADDVTDFLQNALDCLNIRYSFNDSVLEAFPRQGPVLLVANHPFGALDGIILTLIVCRLRKDVRVLGNYFLSRIPGIRNILIPVDPFGTQKSHIRNIKPLRDSIDWLRQGGVIVTFPAGQVSSWSMYHHRIRDPAWNRSIGKLVQCSEATVVPVFFQGRNSLFFHCAGIIHPLLRTVLLPRELINKRGSEIKLCIGQPLPWSRLKRLDHAEKIIRYIRLRTFLLHNHDRSVARTRPVLKQPLQPVSMPEPINSPVCTNQLQAEINALTTGQCIIESGDYVVYHARAAEIPMVLQEIGRLREFTFRQVGEGTGKAVDLDLYDAWYHHLFLWNRAKQELVGAYRLGIVHDILARYGRKGLYTHSLFNFKRRLLPMLDSAIEVGRSFVRCEYQKSFVALNLLWRGIGAFVVQHKICPVLFGPVSISKDYELVSRHLLVDCLTINNFESSLSAMVRPRNPFKARGQAVWLRKELDVIDDLSLVSDIVSELEKDNKGVPILVKQYLKLGGRFVAFNVDPDFSEVVDGLIFVDLRKTDRTVLDKYMGQENAMQFLAGLDSPGRMDHKIVNYC